MLRETFPKKLVFDLADDAPQKAVGVRSLFFRVRR